MTNKSKIILIVLGVLIIGIVIYFSLLKGAAVDSLKCPDDYTDDARTEGMVLFTNLFFDAHPDGSLGDLAEARIQFYKDHNCTAALKRLEDAQRIDDVIYDLIQHE